MSVADLGDVLKKFFGFSTFRPKQREAIQACLEGKDTFICMATGNRDVGFTKVVR
jgi:superfamily II DNA helicase RecQ